MKKISGENKETLPSSKLLEIPANEHLSLDAKFVNFLVKNRAFCFPLSLIYFLDFKTVLF